MDTANKTERILAIFFRLVRGEDLSVSKVADEYGVSSKTISRDMNDIKAFFAENRSMLGYAEVRYSYQQRVYRLYMKEFLTDPELLSLVKILVASRSLNREDMLTLVDKLRSFSSAEDRKLLNHLLEKELYHYSPVRSDVPHVTDRLWQISKAIEEKKEITITYLKMDRSEITRRVLPAAVMQSEYYFYMIAFHKTEQGQEERFYRIDRIKHVIEHRDREMRNITFNEGELRKHNQLMFPGKKRRVVFEFNGPSVQAVLDRLPASRLIDVKNGVSVIEAETSGDGIKMWLLSQGDWVKVIEPKDLAGEIRQIAENIVKKYD